MKIDSCLIIKNEENNIEHLINQLLIFSNEIHITDTGSTDNTIEIINNISKKYSNVFLHHFEWCMDFSKARNYSLYCYECKADYQFWCDCDDELNDILINTLVNFDGTDDIYILKYLYSDNYIIFRSSLINVNKHFEWQDPVHEYLNYEDEDLINYSAFDNGSLLIHHKNNDHINRNVEIFINMERQNYKFSARNRFYFGRELYYNGLNEYAEYQLCKCIDTDDDNIIDKINACIYLFYINGDVAINYFYKLCNNEIFIRKDLLYKVGDYFFNQNKIKLAKIYYLACINFNEPEYWISFNYDTNCHINSLLQLGLIEYNNCNFELFRKYNEDILLIDYNHEIAKYNLSLLNE